MKKMKRVLVALLSCLTAFACLAGTVACGDDKKTNDVPNNNVSTSTDDASKDDNASNDKEEAKPVGGCNGACIFEEIPEEPATCTKAGRAATVQCTVCDYIVDPSPVLLEKSAYASETEYALAKAYYINYWMQYDVDDTKHDYSEMVEAKAATCCTDGNVDYYTCNDCGKYFDENKDGIETVVLSATKDHEYKSFTPAIDATCTEDGRTEGYVCNKSGLTVESKPVPAYGHVEIFDATKEGYIDGSVAATCLTNAHCGRCDKDIENTALGHNYVMAEAKKVTCLENGWDAFEYCDREGCAHTKFAGELKKEDHWLAQIEAENYTTVEAKDPTCLEKGNRPYVVCNDCNVPHDKAQKLSAGLTEEQFKAYDKFCTGGTLTTQSESDKAVPVTCEVDGQTKGGVCSKCKEYVAPQVIKAEGHNFEKTGGKKATCTTDAVCANSYCDYKGGVIEGTATNHDWKFVETEYKACGSAGVAAHYECQNCSMWAVETEEEKEDKKTDNWLDGYRAYNKNADFFNLPIANHNWIDVEAKAPTCSEAGYTAYKYCNRCYEIKNFVVVNATGNHKSNLDEFKSCSKYLVCETIYSTEDADNDGELDIIHVGCGAIYENLKPADCVDEDDDKICDICFAKACQHNVVNADGVCEVCSVCLHRYHVVVGEKVVCKNAACKVEVKHNWVETNGNYYCAGCDTTCVHNDGMDHNVDLSCKICGKQAAEEHDYDDTTKTCKICQTPCQHDKGFNSEYKCNICAADCVHEFHKQTTGICIACDKKVGHNYVAVTGETYTQCSCGLYCEHKDHVQGESTDSVFETVCLNPECGASVKHSYDLSEVTTATTNVMCSVCSRDVLVIDVCQHEGSHKQSGACNVCGMAGVAVHSDANFDGYCDVETCKKQGVGAVFTGEVVINEGISATKVTDEKQKSQWAVRADGSEAKVTIKDGEFDAGNGADYNIAVWAHHGANVVIEGGYFTTGKDANGDYNHVVYAAGGATIEIKGGTFKASDGMDSSMLINCQDGKGTIIITGGTFYNFNPEDNEAEGANTNFLADGYTVEVRTVGLDTIYTVVEKNA